MAESSGNRRLVLFAVLLLVVLFARTIASYIIEFEWWKEMGQVDTWLSSISYTFTPRLCGMAILLLALWVAHARGMKRAGTGLREHAGYGRLASLVMLAVSFLLGSVLVDGWTIARFVGASAAGATTRGWTEPVFGNPAGFYFFTLPLLEDAASFLIALGIVSGIAYVVTWQLWGFSDSMKRWRGQEGVIELDQIEPRQILNAIYVRGAAAVALVGLAIQSWLGRYDLLTSDHRYLVGVDYVNENIHLPLQWMAVAGFAAAAVAVLVNRWKLVAGLALLVVPYVAIPGVVRAVYVRPNEISLQRPYIQRHIEATREAYGLGANLKEVDFPAKLSAGFQPEKHRALVENVRLWDWRAFSDTISQIQALRQYYVFDDIDIDRYTIDGQVRQMLLAPRELNVERLPEARTSWINGHFIYTHGYGLVMADANRVNENGGPVLLVQDAPPVSSTKSIQLTRPEIYFGESMHEPVFVHTQRAEFSYPSGSGNVQTTYAGKGGIRVGSLPMRVIAALAQGEANILLTSYMTPESKMLIRRKIGERVRLLAPFLEWDGDPYIVVSAAGRLVWMIDGYTTSDGHPYSRRLTVDKRRLNYMRNSVKATVDAYDGTTTIYRFDDADPLLQAWSSLFPKLFQPASAMPADLRAHVRYPERIFRTQAEIYRTYHMKDPEAFFNREDLWDIANNIYMQNKTPEPSQPNYVVATLPGESKPEYLLVLPFTPRTKDNMIALMLARCDGEHLGQIVVLLLSKQSLIYGPLQIESNIDSNPIISKDLTLWNQQGSQVLRGQMLVLPVDDSFLYVESLYLQAAQAKMPQLKKVVAAMGSTLVYRDTYEEAIAELTGAAKTTAAAVSAAVARASGGTASPPAPAATATDAARERMDKLRGHMRRYRDLSSQGKWAEAGKELEAIESLLR